MLSKNLDLYYFLFLGEKLFSYFLYDFSIKLYLISGVSIYKLFTFLFAFLVGFVILYDTNNLLHTFNSLKLAKKSDIEIIVYELTTSFF